MNERGGREIGCERNKECERGRGGRERERRFDFRQVENLNESAILNESFDFVRKKMKILLSRYFLSGRKIEAKLK